jgi:hypothetical protein
MAENRALKRLPIAHKPHKYRIANGLTIRTFRHAHSAYESQTLWRGLIEVSRDQTGRRMRKHEYYMALCFLRMAQRMFGNARVGYMCNWHIVPRLVLEKPR